MKPTPAQRFVYKLVVVPPVKLPDGLPTNLYDFDRLDRTLAVFAQAGWRLAAYYERTPGYVVMVWEAEPRTEPPTRAKLGFDPDSIGR